MNLMNRSLSMIMKVESLNSQTNILPKTQPSLKAGLLIKYLDFRNLVSNTVQTIKGMPRQSFWQYCF